MNKDYKQNFPQWVNDTKTKYSLCITDDLDSLLSACLLHEIKGYEINYFYNFNQLYTTGETNNNKAIGVDMALTKGKTWDNHVTMLSPNDYVNKESANLNAILRINRENYTKKYCGSTLLQIWSYYNIPLPQSEEAKMILLAVDSGHLGHYSNKFKDIHTHYLCDVLGFEELHWLLQKHSQEDFERITEKYNLKAKIKIENGMMRTYLDLCAMQGIFSCVNISLPQQKFSIIKEFKHTKEIRLKNDKQYKTSNRIFSLALTARNKVKFTTM